MPEFYEKLKSYYDSQFPYQLIHNWLSYKDESSGGQNHFKFREFSLTLQGDIYVRYQAYTGALEFRNALIDKVPIKIDVGAIYNMNPKLSRAYSNEIKPVARELIFDIDISDYDDVRNCCKEANICEKCWPLMKIGAKILHKILTEEFAFKHLLFVFSGRRGFHCWVCDKSARELGSDARKAIADYFSVIVGGQSMVKRVTLNPSNGIHPMIARALEVIDSHFDEVMIDRQDFLGNDQLVQNVLDLCEDRSLSSRLSDVCKIRHYNSAECWDVIKKFSSTHKRQKGRANYLIEEIKLQHCFPRLDANVTKGFNHLLKLPFCIHPKTGKVCVPIDIKNIDNFDLDSVPNLKTLSRDELDPYIKIMKKFVENLNEDH